MEEVYDFRHHQVKRTGIPTTRDVIYKKTRIVRTGITQGRRPGLGKTSTEIGWTITPVRMGIGRFESR